jgi:molybdenum ABC transporter molybdate-binding protein
MPWKADTGKTVKISYGSSATLAKQIAQGAPADIFVSADLKWMDYLQTNKLIHPETRRNLFSNKLVLIDPSDADVVLEITKGFDLARAAGDGKIAVCAIDSCPAKARLGRKTATETKMPDFSTASQTYRPVTRNSEAKMRVAAVQTGHRQKRTTILLSLRDIITAEKL